MNRLQIVVTVLLALAAGFAGRTLADSGGWVPDPSARAASAARDNETRWEYCVVTKAQYPGSIRGGLYWIAYFKGDRVNTVDIEVGPTGNALAKAFSRLGDEGWEMVSDGFLEVRQGGPGAGQPNAFFFKRRKTDDK